MQRADVVVIGAGQAGLATSFELTRAGVEHVVLERGSVGETWRGRWDSFCLVTPNWTVQLPGGAYDGGDPDGYMPRDEIVAFLERYAAGFDAPIRTGVDVVSLAPEPEGGFRLGTVDGAQLSAGVVVVATGTYRRPHRPATASGLPRSLYQIDADDYRNEKQLPDGRVLVVGSGQTGCQIAEDLLLGGRDVVLSCGRTPWAPRRIGGRDVLWWAIETGFLDAFVDTLPDPSARLIANIVTTGRDGGHDLHVRVLRDAGVTLAGRLSNIEGTRLRFASDLGETIAWGDDRYLQFRELVRRTARERGLADPALPDPDPFDASGLEAIEATDLAAIVFAGGFRPDYQSWIQVPGVVDELGFPVHVEGQSVAAPGLFFVGVHFLRKRKSSLLYGVGEDAALVAAAIA
jgi:putative flavoprotein involved in K+ transport